MVRAAMDRAPPSVKASRDNLMTALLHILVGCFMSTPWGRKHVFTQRGSAVATNVKKAEFFELEDGDEITRETKIQRVIDFVEMLFNLQSVPGFATFYLRLQRAHPRAFEGMYAELQIAKMLYATGYPFRFVRAEAKEKRNDYDFEMMFPDSQIACIEAKCRSEDDPVNPDVIASKLGKARRQLPKDAPGIILMKIPQHWYGTHLIREQLKEIALEFLRNTESVVSVKYYVSVVDLDTEKQATTHRHAYQEITNLRTRFPPRNWHIFEGNPHKPNWVNFGDFL
jgi:hypothetical protein